MKLSLTALALMAIGVSAQSTVSAPCGTACPSAAPDKMITRSAPSASEATPCPSLIVSSIGANGTNGTNPTPGSPQPTHFTGAGNHVAGSVGVVVAAAAVVFAL